jgi:glycosyltransferase involved in cell wall biosynthesis
MLVTIVTPSLNKGPTLDAAIRSVLAQTHQDIEYIIMDACSTDETANVLQRYRGHDAVTIVTGPDSGQADAINKGFSMGRGEVVGWLNADDLLEPNIVELAVGIFGREQACSIVYGDIRVIDELGEQKRMLAAPRLMTRSTLLHENYDVFQPGSFYRRYDVEKVGCLDDSLHFCMDLDLWLKMLKTGSARHAGIVAASFRLVPGTKTATGGVSFLAEINKVLKRHGAGCLSCSRRRLYWYAVKCIVKKWVGL